jgi:hypothetical protein
MKTKLLVSLTAFTIVLAVSAGREALAVEEHTHHSHGAKPVQKLQLNAGKKWATDEALRVAMNEINLAMTKALPSIHQNRFDNTEYQALAAAISRQVAYAVEHCKLEPKADAMLHIIIADLMAGAETMEGKTAHSRHDGAVRVLQALKAYGKYFQHPNWKAAQA